MLLDKTINLKDKGGEGWWVVVGMWWWVCGGDVGVTVVVLLVVRGGSGVCLCWGVCGECSVSIH